MKKQALFITFSGYKDHELIYPYYRLIGAGFGVHVVADKKDARNRVYGIHGANMPCDTLLSDFKTNLDFFFDEYDLLVIPGGVDNTEYLRMVPEVQEFVRRWDVAGKTLSVICHAPQVLISAGVTKNRNLSSFYCIQDDVINSGANYVDAPVVVDDNLISSPHYDHMGPWMEQTLEVYYKLNG
jgi:protease I